MRRFLAGFLAGAIVMSAVAVQAIDMVRLFVDGREIFFPEAPPQIINGRTMVPAKPLAEALGAKVAWDAVGRRVLVTSPPPQVVTKTEVRTLPLTTPHYIWVDGDATDWSLEDVIAAGEGAKGIIIQFGDSMLFAPAPAFRDYFEGVISLEAFLAQSQRYMPESQTAQVAVPAPVVPVTPEIPAGSTLVAEDGTFLGNLTSDKYDTKSICNPYGDQGSKYSAKSIWNEYGKYGGKYGEYSPFNEYSTKPPLIMAKGKVIGVMSVSSTSGALLSPLGLCESLKQLGL